MRDALAVRILLGAIVAIATVVAGPAASVDEAGLAFGAMVTTPGGVLAIHGTDGAAVAVPRLAEALPVTEGDAFVRLTPAGTGDSLRATGTAVTCAPGPEPDVAVGFAAFCTLHDGGQRVGVTFDGFDTGPVDEPVPVAISSHWPIHPRPVGDITGDAVIEPALARWLTDQQVAAEGLRVRRAVEADFDGDGTPERVLALDHHDDWPVPSPGAVSLVVMVSAGNYTMVIADRWDDLQPEAIVHRHDVAGVADLDGDGDMEFLVSSRHAGGYSMTAWSLRSDGRLASVNNTGCGSVAVPLAA